MLDECQAEDEVVEVASEDPIVLQLPQEILELIFSYLPLIAVKTILSQVCTRWCAVANSINLKTFIIKSSYSWDDVVYCIHTTFNLVKIHIDSRKDINEIMHALIMNQNQKLKTLKINCLSSKLCPSLSSLLFLQLMELNPGLENLTLKGVHIDNFTTFTKAIYVFGTHLKSINLNHSTQLGTDEVTTLVNLCPPLEDVRLYGLSFNGLGSVSPYNDSAVESLTENMRDELKVLKLNMMRLTNFSLMKIGQCKNIRRLHLYRLICAEDESLEWLQGITSLDELTVTVPRAISAPGWISLLAQPNLSCLRRLLISNSCTLNDDVLHTIANNCPLLTHLSLPGCRRLGPNGMDQVIMSCQDLIYINLFSTNSSVARSFYLIPESLPNLKVLVFRNFDQKQIPCLDCLSTLPNLKILDTYKYI